eukprot:TsM_000381200 transcript=TsM_000381200 gene=TsM_000381200
MRVHAILLLYDQTNSDSTPSQSIEPIKKREIKVAHVHFTQSVSQSVHLHITSFVWNPIMTVQYNQDVLTGGPVVFLRLLLR